MWTALADCNPRSPQHRPGISALAGSGSVRELQWYRVADSRVVGVPETVRTVDRVRTAAHEIVNLDRIPLHRLGVRNCDECMKMTKNFRGDGVVHEKFAFLRDGVSYIRAQREEETDRIRRTCRRHDIFSRFACLLPQFQNVVERVR